MMLHLSEREPDLLRAPRFGEANLGAMAGLIAGGTLGLFAVGIAPAIVGRNLAHLFATPILGVISWLVSVPVGWVLGGQIGPRLGRRFNSPRLEIAAGAVGGLVPVIAIALWGWYKIS